MNEIAEQLELITDKVEEQIELFLDVKNSSKNKEKYIKKINNILSDNNSNIEDISNLVSLLLESKQNQFDLFSNNNDEVVDLADTLFKLFIKLDSFYVERNCEQILSDIFNSTEKNKQFLKKLQVILDENKEAKSIFVKEMVYKLYEVKDKKSENPIISEWFHLYRESSENYKKLFSKNTQLDLFNSDQKNNLFSPLLTYFQKISQKKEKAELYSHLEVYAQTGWLMHDLFIHDQPTKKSEELRKSYLKLLGLEKISNTDNSVEYNKELIKFERCITYRINEILKSNRILIELTEYDNGYYLDTAKVKVNNKKQEKNTVGTQEKGVVDIAMFDYFFPGTLHIVNVSMDNRKNSDIEGNQDIRYFRAIENSRNIANNNIDGFLEKKDRTFFKSIKKTMYYRINDHVMFESSAYSNQNSKPILLDEINQHFNNDKLKVDKSIEIVNLLSVLNSFHIEAYQEKLENEALKEFTQPLEKLKNYFYRFFGTSLQQIGEDLQHVRNDSSNISFSTKLTDYLEYIQPLFTNLSNKKCDSHIFYIYASSVNSFCEHFLEEENEENLINCLTMKVNLLNHPVWTTEILNQNRNQGVNIKKMLRNSASTIALKSLSEKFKEVNYSEKEVKRIIKKNIKSIRNDILNSDEVKDKAAKIIEPKLLSYIERMKNDEKLKSIDELSIFSNEKSKKKSNLNKK